MVLNEDSVIFDDSHLDNEIRLLRPIDEMLFPNIYIGLNIDLLAPRDGIVTNRHHATSDHDESDDPQDQISGQISPFTLSGWLRHGCERVVQVAGATACHPGTQEEDSLREEISSCNPDSGYHQQGACVDDNSDANVGCVIHDLFGAAGDRGGRIIRRPIHFSPRWDQVDVTRGEARADYRQLNRQVRSRNDDEGQPLQQTTREVVVNLTGTWRLTLRELKPEYVGLLVEAIDHLNIHSDDYEMQLGGARNFGAGVVDAEFINPLYTEAELRRVYNPEKGATSGMTSKDDLWRENLRQEFVRAVQARTAERDGDLPMPNYKEGDTI